MTLTRTTFLFLVVCACLLASCHGIQAGPIIGGVAGGIAALDQLMTQGVIDPVQHHQLTTALHDVGEIATNAINVANQTKQVATQYKEGTLTTTETIGYGGSAILAAFAAFNKYRNLTRKAEIPTMIAAAK